MIAHKYKYVLPHIGHVNHNLSRSMIIPFFIHIPPYGQSNQALEKYCTPFKQVSRHANPGPNRIVSVLSYSSGGANILVWACT